MCRLINLSDGLCRAATAVGVMMSSFDRIEIPSVWERLFYIIPAKK